MKPSKQKFNSSFLDFSLCDQARYLVMQISSSKTEDHRKWAVACLAEVHKKIQTSGEF